MLPSQLKLMTTNDCFIKLPELFISKDTKVRAGDVISVKSVQTEVELSVIWNGQLSLGNFAQLDTTFAEANGFKEELIVLSSGRNLQLQECSLCRVELDQASDYNILKEHTDVGLLDTCRLVYKDIVIPIWVSKHIKVMVKVVGIEPSSTLAILTQSTELQYLHNSKPDEEDSTNPQDVINNPVAFVSHCLGLNQSTTKVWPGAMLVHGETGAGKTHFLKRLMRDYSRFNSELYDCKQLHGKKVEVVRDTLIKLLTNALDNQPFILALDDIDSFVGSNEQVENTERGQEVMYRRRLVECFCHMMHQVELCKHKRGHSIAIVATSRSLDSLNKRLRTPRYFGKTLKIDSPNVEERMKILKSLFGEHKEILFSVEDKQLEQLSKQCRSFMPGDLRLVVELSIRNATSRSLMEFNCERLKVEQEDLEEALKGYLPINLHGLSLQRKSSTRFSDIGGMQEIKDTLRRSVLQQLKHSRLFEKCRFQQQTSVLLYGPPGCGKTLVAEALMNEEGLNSILVSGPELLSKYIGASELAVRNLFERARLAQPCLIFLDEFEALVARRGTDSTGVTDRVVNQFLTMMDGVERLGKQVFLVAASSRPDSIDPAVLRPGRLGSHLYCGPPDTWQERLAILQVLTRHLEFHGEEEEEEEAGKLELEHWARQLEGYTGADLQALLYDAQMMALHETLGAEPLSTPARSASPDDDDNDAAAVARRLLVRSSHLAAAHRAMEVEVARRRQAMDWRYPRAFNQLRGQAPGSRVTLN